MRREKKEVIRDRKAMAGPTAGKDLGDLLGKRLRELKTPQKGR
jgi:hypothetical protein